jgi:hypothetical protein
MSYPRTRRSNTIIHAVKWLQTVRLSLLSTLCVVVVIVYRAFARGLTNAAVRRLGRTVNWLRDEILILLLVVPQTTLRIGVIVVLAIDATLAILRWFKRRARKKLRPL